MPMGADKDIIRKDSENAAKRAVQAEAVQRKKEGDPTPVRGSLENRRKNVWGK